MSTIRIVTEVDFPRPPDAAWDFLVQPAAFETFTGWGPIPGIAKVEWVEGSSTEVGSRGRVHNTDGSVHWEEVSEAERGARYTITISGFESAFRFLTTGAVETWVLSPNDDGTTHGHRTFAFELRSVLLWPFGKLIGAFFRKAVQRNHRNMLAWLEAHPTEPETREAQPST